ncbi:MAG: RdgB/HAM1 family non-canonical purine NTP pyrophosphatase [Verrucomicrobiales bacterium]|nr:RdgB/HAM1 family non-canonical purine NTP pyrophosphatase [Verrucomicrobiales bacterium]
MPAKLVVATHNAHKTDEIREIVGKFFDEVLDLSSFPDVPEADEYGESFEENSAIKAFGASETLQDAFILADDSGLEVDALNGAPGVYSARYAGADASDADNRARLLEELTKSGAKGKERSARFRCVLTVVKGDETFGVFDGACEGIIANEEKGDGGFGYDSLFIPEGHCETFGQLSGEVKNGMSHRGNALAQFSEWLESEQ